MPGTTKVIDIHTHFVPQGVAEVDSTGRDFYGIGIRENDDGRLAFSVGGYDGVLPWGNFRHTPEERLADMDARGIDTQVVSFSPALVQYRADPKVAAAGAREINDQLADWSRRWPERFAGLAFLPLQDPSAAVEELRRAVEDCGLVGAGVHTHVNGTNWDDEALFPVLAAAEELDAVVFIHPAQVRVRDIAANYHLRNMCGNPWETTIAVGSLIFSGVLDRLPNLKVALAHGGGYTAFAAGRFDHGYGVRPESQVAKMPPSDYLRRFYFDTITHSPSGLRYLIDTVGAENVVIGSDYPADMGTPNPVAWLDGIESIRSDEKRMILGENAQRMLQRRA